MSQSNRLLCFYLPLSLSTQPADVKVDVKVGQQQQVGYKTDIFSLLSAAISANVTK